MPREKLTKIIEIFRVQDFTLFFRLKTQAQGNFRPNEEKLTNYNDNDFSGIVKLGQIEFSETEKLIIVVAKVAKGLSERSGKKAQYDKAKKILKDLQIFVAGIFVFYDDSGNFRFSLIYPESFGTRRQWSNFRRYTYFVSREFTNKTFLQQIGDGDFSTFAKIKDAFSVEKVTKEFYLEYRKLFESLLGELSKNHTFLNEAARNGLNTENFAKKLLGQIVFLYFVQKKGWVGVPEGHKWGEGDKNFLSNLFKEAKNSKKNFFNDYLEKLFYNVLNNPRRDSADPSFFKDFNCRIPFLNGGLFEAEYNWKDSLIYLDDKIFQAFFDVFDRYNFTVEEEGPDDKEIAVDPEMLGKVFENLLPENLRKGKGIYYTPREIVYYMCQESLINYLDSNSKIGRRKAEEYVKFLREVENKSIAAFEGEAIELDELLKNIKVCDPACGSGAFLVGMLNEIVRLRLLLRILHPKKLAEKTEYELKKETIQNCIYGVDIDPGAIEIAKLRLWLQLVVDYELKDIEPLPNLDYRLMCGNSLLEEFEGVKFYNGENTEQQATLLVDTEKQKKIAELKKEIKEYFNIHDDKEKHQKRNEINEIKDWLVRSVLEKRKQDLVAQRKNEETKANMLNQKSREKYLASWGDKFLAGAKIKEVLDNLHNPKAAKPFFIWKLEFIDVFEDKKGFDLILGNPPYVSAVHNQDDPNLRKLYKATYSQVRGASDLYVIFLLRGVNIGNDKSVYSWIIPNKFLVADYAVGVREYLKNNGLQEVIVVSNLNVFGDTCVYPIIILGNKQHKSGVIEYELDNLDDLSFKNRLKIREKIESSFKIVKNLGLKVGSGTTGFQAQQVKKLVVESRQKSAKSMPFIVSGSIDKYSINYSNVRFLKRSFNRPFINYKKGAIADSKWAFWENPKIIVAGMTREIEAVYTTEPLAIGIGVYAVYTFNGFDPKYILALLNSKYLSYFFKINFKDKHLAGGYLAINKSTIEQLPIVEAAKEEQKPFVELVEKILAITRSGDYLENKEKQAKVREYEKQIDQMVYKLYGLTENEIRVIENN